MKINSKLITSLKAAEQDATLATILRMALKTNGKEKELKIDNDELAIFLNYGRDKNDKVLSDLVALKWITREQTRDENGNFDHNIIKVICPFIS